MKVDIYIYCTHAVRRNQESMKTSFNSLSKMGEWRRTGRYLFPFGSGSDINCVSELGIEHWTEIDSFSQPTNCFLDPYLHLTCR